MECGDYDRRYSSMARGPGAVGLQLNFSGERAVPLAIASRVPRKPARPVVLDPPSRARDARPVVLDPPSRARDARHGRHVLPPDGPFMNDMDEISYWIHTKRAPCLMNYDNLIKKQNEEAQSSKTVTEEVPSPKKRKKKRKLSLLDEDSVSTEKQQNVYFEVSHRQNQPVINRCKSDSLGSDVDFNIKNTSMGEKPKKARLQKSNRTKIHKKATVVASTPKTTVHLRRSLRQAQQSNSNANLNNTLEIYNAVVSNGHFKSKAHANQKSTDKVNKSTQMFAAGDQVADSKHNTSQRNKSKNALEPNGQFEDVSDVSGFTANYIRSTKVQSGKAARKLRCKSSRALVKDSRPSSRNNNMVICINKSMNTGVPKANVLNCSTDSSQNVINLVTSKTNEKSEKIDKSTSLLKFVDTRSKSKEAPAHKNVSKQKSNLNVSFQSQSSTTSRYPKRYKNHTDASVNTRRDASVDAVRVNTRRAGGGNRMEFNNSDKKENPDETVGSRTRSGRNVNLSEFKQDNSVLVVSNSTEQVSSMQSLNVASPPTEPQRRRRAARARRPDDKSGHSLRRDSLRDKSGFTACFSESDDDSVPLMRRKYFCN